MGLETATYISGLDANNPVTATDPVSEGSNHLRLIKATLLNTFPNVSGAVNASQAELNRLVGVAGVTGSGNLVLSDSPTFTGSLSAATVAAASFIGGTIAGDSLTLTTPLGIASGGTGAATASAARSALGLAIGSDVQAYDADLTTLAGLAKTDGNFIVGNGSAWTVESDAVARNSLSLGTGDSPQFNGVNIGHASDSAITRDGAGQLAIAGRPIVTLEDGTFTSSKIWIETTAATGGNDGDIWLEY